MCSIADPFFVIEEPAAIWLATEIAKDYLPKMTIDEINQVFIDGIKGKFVEAGTKLSINSIVIYQWLKKGYLETESYKKTWVDPSEYIGNKGY